MLCINNKFIIKIKKMNFESDEMYRDRISYIKSEVKSDTENIEELVSKSKQRMYEKYFSCEY